MRPDESPRQAGREKQDVAGMLARLAVRRRAALVRVAADQYLI